MNTTPTDKEIVQARMKAATRMSAKKQIAVIIWGAVFVVFGLAMYFATISDNARMDKLNSPNITMQDFVALEVNEPEAHVTTDFIPGGEDNGNLGIKFTLKPWQLTKSTAENEFKFQIEWLVPTIFYKWPNVNKITLMADAEFRDKRGQSSTDRAMVVTFTRKNSDSINWGEVRTDDLMTLADFSWKQGETK